MTDVIDFLLSRRSVLASNLSDPGPNEAELEQILRAATRVPDHKKLTPWRFIIFQNEARKEFGDLLAKTCTELEGDITETRYQTEKTRFLRAPLVVAVIYSPVENPKVPEFEQILSTGAVGVSLLNAAAALGFAAQWITEWYAYQPQILSALGLKSTEKVAGFVYVGSAAQKPNERDRPDLKTMIQYWGDGG